MGDTYACLFPDLLSAIRIEAGLSQWPRSLRLRSAAARLLRLWVRIPPGHGYQL